MVSAAGAQPDRGLTRLDAGSVQATISRLERRISARFPGRGLSKVAAELQHLTADVAEGSATVRERLGTMRMLSRVLITLVLAGTTIAIIFATKDAAEVGPRRTLEWLPLIESSVNDLVFAAIAVVFLHAIPHRIERGHTLRLLHRLRSLAHIIDMHQLTKDPERLRPDYMQTTESIDVNLSRDDMERYLDYCSEMLSLVGKAAALCAEESQDSVVLDTVSTIETLTTGMARKIWQKISLLPD
jgi:hypothetical protein